MSRGSSTVRRAGVAVRQRVQGAKARVNARRKILLNLADTFPAFAPSSAGNFRQIQGITKISINSTVPELELLWQDTHQTEPIPVVDASQFCTGEAANTAAAALRQLLDRHGSDKARGHGYELVYGRILSASHEVETVLEVGLGTNDPSVVSNMGRDGIPGASLRAFRDFLPNAEVFGADVDSEILFSEHRIQTFWCDQTDSDSMRTMLKNINRPLDLVVDDGLHCPFANLITLRHAMPLISNGGWIVIEDIAEEHLPIWKLAGQMASDAEFDVKLVKAVDKYLLVLQRV